MKKILSLRLFYGRLNATGKLKISGVRKKNLLTLSLLLMSFVCNAQLLQWNTYGNTGTETTEPSVYNDANISSTNLTQGTITAAANGNRFGGSGWFNTGNTPAGNTLTEAIAGNDYIQFIVTPNSGYCFTATSFVFSWQSSATGPKNVALRSSIDGYGANLGTTAVTDAITSYTITISGISSVSTATTFRLYGYGATATAGTGGFDIASSVVNVQLNGTTSATGPVLTVSALAGFGEKCINSTYGPESFTITGTNLTTANVTVGALSGYTYCTTSGGTYTSSLSLSQSGGSYSQVIYVKFNPTAVQSYNGNIAVGGGGASSVNCSAVGAGVNSSSITTHPSSQTITAGSNVNFTVVATNPASYQWQENQTGTWNNLSNGGVYSNVTTATMTITGVTAGMTGYKYKCIVTSTCSGTVTSNEATLTVSSGPAWLINEEFTSTTGPANLATTTTGPFTSSGTWFTDNTNVANRSAKSLFMSNDGVLTTPQFSNADLLAFWVGYSTGNKSADIEIEQTTDGTNWTTLATITDISLTSQYYFYELASSVIKIRFNYYDGNNCDINFDDVMVRSANHCVSDNLIERVLVNSCAATDEGVNEMILVNIGNTAIDIDNLLVTFPSADPGTFSFGSTSTKTFVTNPTYTSALNTLAGCTVAYEPPGGIVPANSKLVIFSGATPEFTYDFSSACGIQSYYVIYCNNTNISGRFANAPDAGTNRYTSIIDISSGCYDQVYYDDNIPVADGWQAMYDLSTRALSYGNYGCTEVILPIQLLSFESTCAETNIILQWTTATEINNDFFSLERSADAKNFTKIADIKGAGNSNDVLNYSFTDADPLNGTSYYRLVQNDYNGNTEIFGPVTARCEGIGDNDFHIVNINNDGVTPRITYYISTSNTVTICVYNIEDRRILCEEQAGEAGNRQMDLEIKTGAGLYFISLTDGDKVLSTRVFIK